VGGGIPIRRSSVEIISSFLFIWQIIANVNFCEQMLACMEV